MTRWLPCLSTYGKRSASWEMYVKHRPSLQDIPEIGRVDTQTFSVEKAISLKPRCVDVSRMAIQRFGLGY